MAGNCNKPNRLQLGTNTLRAARLHRIRCSVTPRARSKRNANLLGGQAPPVPRRL
jgi:hypothetical protein